MVEDCVALIFEIQVLNSFEMVFMTQSSTGLNSEFSFT